MLTTIVIPVYNSAKTIGPLADKLTKDLNPGNLQIVLVNDGSSDNSHEVCCNLRSKYPAVITCISLSRNFGEHNAVMAGLNYSKGEYTVIMDDDFQNPPGEVMNLINLSSCKKYDIVYTYYKKKQHHWFRNMGSAFNNFVASFMLDKPRDLYLSSFKCLSRFTVREIVKYKGPFPYIDGLALRCTKNIGRLEVSHEKRQEGRSGYTFRKLIRLWLNMFVNFSVMPLRASFFIGLLFSFLGAILSVFVVMDKILHPEVPIGWPSLFIAIMTFSGVQLFILGIFGEYLGHLFMSSNQTSQFVIREVYEGNVK